MNPETVSNDPLAELAMQLARSNIEQGMTPYDAVVATLNEMHGRGWIDDTNRPAIDRIVHRLETTSRLYTEYEAAIDRRHPGIANVTDRLRQIRAGNVRPVAPVVPRTVPQSLLDRRHGRTQSPYPNLQRLRQASRTQRAARARAADRAALDRPVRVPPPPVSTAPPSPPISPYSSSSESGLKNALSSSSSTPPLSRSSSSSTESALNTLRHLDYETSSLQFERGAPSQRRVAPLSQSRRVSLLSALPLTRIEPIRLPKRGEHVDAAVNPRQRKRRMGNTHQALPEEPTSSSNRSVRLQLRRVQAEYYALRDDPNRPVSSAAKLRRLLKKITELQKQL